MRGPPSKESREAVEALQQAIAVGLFVPRPKGPGQVIMSLPTKTREALQKLTSDDLARLRVDYVPMT